MSFWAVNTEILACLELRKHSRGFLPEFRNVLIRMRQRKRIKTQYEASWSWNAKIKHQHIINIYQRPFMTLRIYSLVHVNSFKCSITVGRKRLDCCWIWTQYWIYMFLTKRVDGKRSKAETIKWGKHGFSWRLQNSQQPAPSISMLWCVWEIHKDYFSHLHTCAAVFLRSASSIFPSYLLYGRLAQPGHAGMCGKGSSQAKKKGKTVQKMWTGWGMWGWKGRVDPDVWGWEIVACPQWLASEWMDLCKKCYRKGRAKLFSEAHSRRTRVSEYSL